ncbi:hypothetical protein UMM65_15855 [Aureibaculum sp. 2210JD6-5]|uniref:hypothetical protein n=1 Tax=Aureibaculum sp. 2210JD6-5 TaxID=3103957 RepID=UPI002AAE5409|nr:hypothetical protein [Aureibaculum sp. 2210JD6-5]MDY7396723.1 hypothetical protein [Aureibaculum sp. 2210JD6-5]
MKKIIGIFGVAVLAMVMFFSVNAISSSNGGLDLASISTMNTANAEIPIQLGTKNCVCKGSTCQDANWVSFRKYCGYGENSDIVCSQWNYKC